MKGAQKLIQLLNGAQKGGFSLKKLNFALNWAIPFNKRHNFVVKEIGEDYVRTFAPYKRKNFNHIKGIHACGIATISEFATGLLLLRKVDPAKYRIIMSKLEIEYFFQAKKDLIAEARLDDETLRTEIVEPLQKEDAIYYTVEAKVHDVDGNHISTAQITWQIKNWKNVKTKV